MLVVERSVQEAYGHFLSSLGILKKEQNLFQRWLRCYLDFCTEYQHKVTSSRSLDAYLRKLSEKNQTDQQRDQANRAIQFYQSSLKKDSATKRDSGFIRHTSTPPVVTVRRR